MPSTFINIRPATDHDGRAIGELIASVFADYDNCRFLWSEFPELNCVATHYARHDGVIWLVEDGGRCVGSLAVFRSAAPATFELSKVYLRRSVRGRGIAQQLLSMAFDHARERGAGRMELFTDTRFIEGHRFYERTGFDRLPGERYLPDASDTWEYHYARDLGPT
jgi:putative acetyltransferase